ncbi:MAG: pyridoxamine 5'-phosphate oxidase family protein [Ilumatobacteraceae bacterium]
MTTTDGAQALDDLLDAPVIVMLMTMIGDEHSSLPLTCVAVHEECLDFLVDQETEWAQAIAAGTARVHVTVADERHNTYVSLNGPATLSTDRDEIDRCGTLRQVRSSAGRTIRVSPCCTSRRRTASTGTAPAAASARQSASCAPG